MNERREAMKEWIDLVMEARKKEDEMLDIPRRAAQSSNTKVDLLFTSENSAKMTTKYQELQGIEKKRDEARKKFLQLLG